MGESEHSETWSISIKQVNEADQSGFTLQVSPEDDIARLQKQIEGITGLEPSQQRLIYRGRLIGGNNWTADTNEGDASRPVKREPTKIKDIAGLGNGHTIHLLKKRETASTAAAENEESAPTETDRISNGTSSSSPGGDFLAALLAVGDSVDSNNNNENMSASSAGARWRTPRIRSSRRRLHHRLQAEDLDQSDPGSFEPVRQSLMTIHTMVAAAEVQSPIHVNRQWYTGQWIDCLDTVNQWLEATVVEVVDPDNILPPRQASQDSTDESQRTEFITFTETRNQASFIAAADLDRRAFLLLEPCEDGDPGDEGGEYFGWKRRDNSGVQLLLVHYNGWPHRWDEWIRSDSDRIRPFRTRTRHPNASPYASPTPQSAYAESPPTFIRSNVESEDRDGLLPEIGRVVNQVNSLLNRIIANSYLALDDARSEVDSANLPWMTASNEIVEEIESGEERKEDSLLTNSSVSGDDGALSSRENDGKATSNRKQNRLTARDLEVLAPLFDRLGRTLIDAAPHVAALARAARVQPDEDAPLTVNLESVEDHPTSLAGLLSLLSRDRRRHQSASSSNVGASTPDSNSTSQSSSTAVGNLSDTVSIVVDPDHVDFSAAVVNTTRGEVRSGPRNRTQSNSDEAASLLGAYLAAASLSGLGGSITGDTENGLQGLGRILRDQNGAGIDIHIHAVVTAPGMPAGALGLAGLVDGGGGVAVGSPGVPAIASPDSAGGTFMSHGRSSSSRSSRSNSLRRRVSSNFLSDDDEMGIFSELYSENPGPLEHATTSSTTTTAAATAVEEVTTSPHEDSSPVDPLQPHRSRSASGSSRRSRRNGSSGNEPVRSDSTVPGRAGGSRLLDRFFRRNNSSN